MGFDAKSTGAEVLTRPETGRIIDHIPDDIKDEELHHPILLGYISDGQVHFLVCAVNQRELHIRLQAPLFLRLRRACVELVRKNRSLSFRRRLIGWVPFVQPKRPYITLTPTIQVLEPGRDEPTIEGTIVNKAFVAAVRRSSDSTIISVLFGSLALTLFFFAREVATVISGRLSSKYSVDYVEGAIERMFSALLVTSLVAGLGVLIRYLELRRTRPIEWDVLTGSRPSRQTRVPTS